MGDATEALSRSFLSLSLALPGLLPFSLSSPCHISRAHTLLHSTSPPPATILSPTKLRLSTGVCTHCAVLCTNVYLSHLFYSMLLIPLPMPIPNPTLLSSSVCPSLPLLFLLFSPQLHLHITALPPSTTTFTPCIYATPIRPSAVPPQNIQATTTTTRQSRPLMYAILPPLLLYLTILYTLYLLYLELVRVVLP